MHPLSHCWLLSILYSFEFQIRYHLLQAAYPIASPPTNACFYQRNSEWPHCVVLILHLSGGMGACRHRSSDSHKGWLYRLSLYSVAMDGWMDRLWGNFSLRVPHHTAHRLVHQPSLNPALPLSLILMPLTALCFSETLVSFVSMTMLCFLSYSGSWNLSATCFTVYFFPFDPLIWLLRLMIHSPMKIPWPLCFKGPPCPSWCFQKYEVWLKSIVLFLNERPYSLKALLAVTHCIDLARLKHLEILKSQSPWKLGLQVWASIPASPDLCYYLLTITLIVYANSIQLWGWAQHMSHVCMEVREQLLRATSLLPPWGLGIRSGHLTWAVSVMLWAVSLTPVLTLDCTFPN